MYYLIQTLKPLTEAEEARIAVVLSEMAEQVRRRRLMMYTYFKDYDRVNIDFIKC